MSKMLKEVFFKNLKKFRIKVTVTNVSEALFPLRLLNIIWGLSPIEIHYNVVWAKLSILYHIVRTLIFTFLLWYTSDYEYKYYKTRPIIMIVYQICLYLNLAVATACIILHLSNYEKLKKIEQQIIVVDETLKIFGVRPTYLDELKQNLNLVCIWVLTGSALFAVNVYSLDIFTQEPLYEAFSISLVRDFITMFNTITELNFAIKASAIGKRFKMLNGLIEHASLISKGSISTNLKTSQLNFKNNVTSRSYFRERNNLELLLKIARQLHLGLCKNCRELDRIFGYQFSIQLVASSVLLIGYSYNTYLFLKSNTFNGIDGIINIALTNTWMIFILINIIYAVKVATSVMQEAKQTSQLAHDIYVTHSKSKITDEIHQLALQILQNPLNFTVSGVAVFDFSLVKEFLQSIITYFVLLVQYQSQIVQVANDLVVADNTTDSSTLINNATNTSEYSWM